MARSGIMLCYPFEEKRLAKWRPPYLVQPKLDGERCRAIWTRQGYLLLSSEENLITSVPHINEQLNAWAKVNTPYAELDGELYRHGWAFEEIHSVVGRTANLHQHHELIEYHIFDIVTEKPQLERTAQLHTLPVKTASVITVPYRLCTGLEDLMQTYQEYIDDGYEGIIVRQIDAPYVRRRSTFVMKFKPKREDTYEIVDFHEAISQYDVPLAMVGAILCRGDDGTVFKAGAGQLSHHERTASWKQREYWQGKTIRIGYQNLTATGGVPRFGICTELIDEPFLSKTEDFFNPLL